MFLAGIGLITALLAAAAPQACNGFPDLCDRPYDKVAYATTHNAMAAHEMGFAFPNQRNRMRKQLDDGIRGLMLDLHKEGDTPMLCHGPCALGKQDLVEGLVEIREFLDANPNEVITLLLEPSGVNAAEIAAAFSAADFTRYCFPYAAGAPWPTLREMITTGQRAVVLTDRDTGDIPWLLPMWSTMWDTNWNIKQKEQFDCECNRGKTTQPLFNLNHFMQNPLPFPANAEIVNRNPFLYERAKKCMDDTGRIPNFVTVDHYHIGDIFEAVNRLNGVGEIKAP